MARPSTRNRGPRGGRGGSRLVIEADELHRLKYRTPPTTSTSPRRAVLIPVLNSDRHTVAYEFIPLSDRLQEFIARMREAKQ